MRARLTALRSAAFSALSALLLCSLLLTATVGASAQTLGEIQEQLAEAQAERAEIEERVEQAVARYDDLQTRIAQLEAEREELEAELTMLRGDLDELAELIVFRVRETFKHGSTLDPIVVFLSSDDPDTALLRAETVQRVVAGDQARSEELAAARARVRAAEERLAEHSKALDEALEEQQAVTEALQADFERVQELEARLTKEEREERERLERERREREERERREREQRERERQARDAAARTAASRSSGSPSSGGGSSGGSGGGMVCPLDQPRSFTDTWGAPRSGGRGHRGTDIMGPHGIPVRAITSGTWQIQGQGPSAGLWGILRGDDGDHYWYLHLASHTVSNGARVSAGQQVATNGATGNAPPNAPHVHFERHPGGGSAVNPYPLLRQVCG